MARRFRFQPSLSFELLEDRTLLASFQFVGGFDGNAWSSARNWLNLDTGKTDQGVPGLADTATLSGTTTVVLDQDTSVGTVSISAGGISASSRTFTATNWLWSGGSLTSGTFVNNGILTISGDVTLAGTLSNRNQLQIESGSLNTNFGFVTNTPGSIIEIADGATLGATLNPNSSLQIDNQGTIIKPDGSGTGTISAKSITRVGARIESAAGTLQLGGWGHTFESGSTFRRAAGAVIDVALTVSNQKLQLNSGARLDGDGLIRVATGIVSADGAFDFGQFLVDAGSNSSTQAQFGDGALTIRSGTVDLRRAVTLGSIENLGTLRYSNPNTDTFHGATLVNRGIVEFATPRVDAKYWSYGSFDNRAGSLIRVTKDLTLATFGGNLLKNSGTFRVESGVNGVSINTNAGFVNSGGTFDIRSGTLDLSQVRGFGAAGDLMIDGAIFQVAPGAMVDAGIQGQGIIRGTLRATGGGRVLIGGGGEQFRDVTLHGDPGMFEVESQLHNSTGIRNIGDVALRKSLFVPFENYGTARFVESASFAGIFDPNPIGKFTNRSGGVVTIAPGVTIGTFYFGGGIGTELVNEGVVRFEGGNALGLHFINNGSVESIGNVTIYSTKLAQAGLAAGMIPGDWTVRNGPLTLNVGAWESINAAKSFGGIVTVSGSQAGLAGLPSWDRVTNSLTVREGATLSFPNVFVNDGALSVDSGGKIVFQKGFTQSPAGTFEAGVTNATSFGTLTVTGTASLDGTLRTRLATGFALSAADRFEVLTAAKTTGAFTRTEANGLIASVSPTAVVLQASANATDLAVEGVQILDAVAPGQPFRVQYSVRNLSAIPVATAWSDAIFASAGATLGLDAISLGVSPHTPSLAAYASVTNTVTVVAPETPGDWNLFVAADRSVAIVDPNRGNNIGRALEGFTIDAPLLTLGIPQSRFVAAGATAFYRLIVPVDSGPIRVRAAFPGDGELRIARSAVIGPDTRVAFAVPATAGREATLDLADPVPGTYFVSVISRSGGPVTTRADFAPLAITGIDNGGSVSRQLLTGDTLTLTVLGTGFTDTTAFSLGDRPATSVTRLDAAAAVVTFTNLTAGGPLTLTATRGSDSSSFGPATFTIAAPADPWRRVPQFSTVIHAPATVRPNRDIRASVTVRNESGVSLPAPLVQLATDNGRFRLADRADEVTGALTLLAVAPSGRPDPFAPGESRTFDLIVRPERTGNGVTSDLVATVVAESNVTATVANGQTVPVVSPIALPANVFADFRPPTMNADAWTQVIRPNLEALVGGTVGSYANAIRSVASLFSADGADARDVGRLTAFLISLADDFGTISNRFELSALGRGVPNPWDYRATVESDGSVFLRQGFSIRPFFASFGQYKPMAGDRGRLETRPGGGWILTEIDGTRTSFRTDGRWDTTTDRLGRVTTAAYTNGRITTITDPVGDVTTFVYTGDRLTTITDPVGRVTTMTYTGELLTAITTPRGATTFAYDPATTGARAFTLTRVTGPDGVPTNLAFDDRGRLARTTIGNGQLATDYAYSFADVIVTTVAGTTNMTRGPLGQLSALRTATGTTVDRHFDDLGRIRGQTTAVGRESLVRDANGNIVESLAGLGSQLSLTYDPAGVDPTTLMDSLGRITEFRRLTNGLTAEQVAPDGRRERYAYDAQGRMTAVTTEAGRTTTYAYDAKGLLTRVMHPDGTVTAIAYDTRRNFTGVTETPPNATARTMTFAYDPADRVTGVTHADGKVITYRYDAAGRLDRMIADGVATDYVFDELGRLVTVRRDGVVQVVFAFDAMGRLVSKSFANGTSTVYAYDADDRTTRIEHRGIGGAVLDFQAYSYDAAGRTVALTTPEGTTSYTYDALGQLIRAVRPGGIVVDYAVDAAGNRTTFNVDNRNRYSVGSDGTRYTYDAEGNLATVVAPDGTETRYAYDARNRLVSRTGPGGTFSYEYDPLGNRSAVVNNGVRTSYLIDPTGGADGLADVIAEYDSKGRTAEYLLSDGIEARFDAAGKGSFYHFDAIGNAAAVTGPDGTVSASYRYLPFGEVASESGPAAAANPVTFNGRWGVRDLNDGLYDMRARVYEPGIGRFTQEDPIGLAAGDGNLYRFVFNNPASFTDPSGLVLPAAGYLSTAYLSITSPGLFVPELFVPALTTIGQASGFLTGSGVTTAGLIYPVPLTAPGLTSIGIASGFEAVPAAAVGTEIATLGTGALTIAGLIAVSPLILVAGDIIARNEELTQAQKAGPAPTVTPDVVSNLIRTQTKLHPSLKTLIDQYRQDNNGNDPPFETIIRWKQLITQGEQEIGQTKTTQAAPIDPNDIVGPAGYGLEGFLQPVGEFGYTIRFQNLPTAPVAAQEVFLSQTLDADLDWESFRFTSFGWAGRSFDATGRTFTSRIADPASNSVVELIGIFNASTGRLDWTFRTLDPITLTLPEDAIAGFLPPDDASGRGQGFLTYTIRPKPNAPTGTRYDAQARIIFDTETPIDTPAIRNTADSGRPNVTVHPLPATTASNKVTVSWAGADDAGGSGVSMYDIFVSVDSGAWTQWLQDTKLTSSTYTGNTGQTVAFYATSADHVNLTSVVPSAAQATTKLGTNIGTNPLLLGVPQFAVGGSGSLTMYNADATPRFTLLPFSNFLGTVRTAVADFTGDGVGDLVVGTGPGSATHVKVFDGVTKAELFSLAPFEASFTGGIYVAAGDITGDGKADLVITPDEGGGPRARVFSGNGFTQIADFFGIDDPNFRGGARASIGDLNGDGKGDLLVAAGFGGGPRVAAYDGARLDSNGGPKLFGDFFAFEQSLRNGTFIAAGDVNGDGFADLVAGGGPGGGPRVYILDGQTLISSGSINPIGNFFAGDINSRGGIRVTVKDLDGDNKADLVVGAGSGAGSRVTAYRGSQISLAGGTPPELFAFDASVGALDGVFVG